MNLGVVDDEPDKVIAEERNRETNRDRDQYQPQQELNQNISQGQGVDQLVLVHGFLP
jgi:hypothetical protein